MDFIKNNYRNTISGIALFSALTTSNIFAQDIVSYNIEFSPAYFIMKGYGVDPSINFYNNHSLGLTFSEAEFPHEISNLFFSDIGKENTVKWSIPYAIQYRYHLNGYKSDGPVVGLALGKEKWKIKEGGIYKKIDNNLSSLFFSYKKGITDRAYISPTLFILSNSNINNKSNYNLRKLSIGANITAGYTF